VLLTLWRTACLSVYVEKWPSVRPKCAADEYLHWSKTAHKCNSKHLKQKEFSLEFYIYDVIPLCYTLSRLFAAWMNLIMTVFFPHVDWCLCFVWDAPLTFLPYVWQDQYNLPATCANLHRDRSEVIGGKWVLSLLFPGHCFSEPCQSNSHVSNSCCLKSCQKTTHCSQYFWHGIFYEANINATCQKPYSPVGMTMKTYQIYNIYNKYNMLIMWATGFCCTFIVHIIEASVLTRIIWHQCLNRSSSVTKIDLKHLLNVRDWCAAIENVFSHF